jgi:hypothetical protein
MYIGQVAPALLNTWIYDDSSHKMHKSNVYFSPALVKVHSHSPFTIPFSLTFLPLLPSFVDL